MTPYKRYNEVNAGGRSEARTKSKNKMGILELQCIICGLLIIGLLLFKSLGGEKYLMLKQNLSHLFTQSSQTTSSQTTSAGALTTSQTSGSAITQEEVAAAVVYIKSLLPSGVQVDDSTIEKMARQYLENKTEQVNENTTSQQSTSSTLSSPPTASNLSTSSSSSSEASIPIPKNISQSVVKSTVTSTVTDNDTQTGNLSAIQENEDLVPTALLTDTDFTKTASFAQKAAGGLLAAPVGASFSPFFPDVTMSPPLKGQLEISCKFGYRYHPITGQFGFHTGVDLPQNAGTYIYAAAAGKIVDSGYSYVWGNYILIQHDASTQTFYAHCQKLIKKKGDTVKKGQLIAKVGTTGMSTGAHLHFEIRINGIYMDPNWFLQI